MANLKFYRGAEPKTPVAGYIWFDNTNSTIKVYTGTAWEPYAGKLIDATWDGAKKQLTLVKQDGASSTIDFSDVASAAALSALTEKLEACDLAAVGANGSFISSVSQSDGQVAASATAFASSVTATGVIAPTAKAVNDFVVGKINALDVAEVSSDASHGAVVTVSETDGKINKPKIEITPGSVAASNDSVVTGGAVYTAIDTAKSDLQKAINTAVGSVYKVKGTVASYADLQKITSPTVGDVYNVTAANGNIPAGTNYVWVGVEGEVAAHWDALGGTVDLTPYAKKADLKKSDTAVSKQVVSAVSEENGIITVSRRALVADDIPTLNISKISGLQDALDSATNAGVTSFGGETGEITLREAGTANGSVNLLMNGHVLGAQIVGLDSAAFTSADDYKKVQTAIAGKQSTAAKTLTGIAQDAQGVITPTFSNIAIDQTQVNGLSEALDEKAKSSEVLFEGVDKNINKTFHIADSTSSRGAHFVKIESNYIGIGYDGSIGLAYSDGKLLVGNDADPTGADPINITNVKVPAVDLDAANKKYVDETAAAAANNVYREFFGDDTYITVGRKDSKVSISAKTQAVSTASTTAKGLADAYDVKTYVDSAIKSADTMSWAAFE